LPERESIKAEGGMCEAVPTREVMCAPLVEDAVTRWDGGERRGGGRKWDKAGRRVTRKGNERESGGGKDGSTLIRGRGKGESYSIQ
jgi:hypothetical protein